MPCKLPEVCSSSCNWGHDQRYGWELNEAFSMKAVIRYTAPPSSFTDYARISVSHTRTDPDVLSTHLAVGSLSCLFLFRFSSLMIRRLSGHVPTLPCRSHRGAPGASSSFRINVVAKLKPLRVCSAPLLFPFTYRIAIQYKTTRTHTDLMNDVGSCVKILCAYGLQG